MLEAKNDRAEIFARLKAANTDRDKTPHPGAVKPPKRANKKGQAKLDQFIEAATTQYATIDDVASFAEIPLAMATWLRGQNLPQDCVIAPILQDLDWSAQSGLAPKFGPATTADMVGVSVAFAGAAETGTVMMIANEATPTTLNFVPDVEIIAISKKDIEAGLEGCWKQLRQWKKTNPMPRAVNFITGPSRTADVEATMVLGAHGPRRLHLILVDEASPWRKNP